MPKSNKFDRKSLFNDLSSRHNLPRLTKIETRTEIPCPLKEILGNDGKKVLILLVCWVTNRQLLPLSLVFLSSPISNFIEQKTAQRIK